MMENRISPEHIPRNYEYNGMAAVSLLPDQLVISDSFMLRKIVPEDAGAIFDMIERNPDIPKHVAFAKDITKLDEVLPSLRSRSNETLDGRYAITAHDGLVGSIWAFSGNEEREFGIGYCLDRTARGNGYATQAARKMIEQLQVVGAAEVYFQIIIGNADSDAISR